MHFLSFFTFIEKPLFISLPNHYSTYRFTLFSQYFFFNFFSLIFLHVKYFQFLDKIILYANPLTKLKEL